MQNNNTQKDPKDWKTGDERATGAQKSYIETMATEAEIDVDTKNLTKAEAAEKIEELQKKTGRGQKNATH
jgi:hypothetical protein